MGAVRGKFFLPSLSPVAFLSPNTNPKGFNFSPPVGDKVKDGGHGITTKTNNFYYARIAGHRLKT